MIDLSVAPGDLREAIETELARRQFLPFVKRLKPDYQVGAHHKLLTGILECVDAGVVNRLMTLMPPRMGKSELVSKKFPAWMIGRKPNLQYIAASYAQELADDFSKDARDCVRSEKWPFPEVKLAGDAFAVRRWRTTAGGIYVAAGVGGPITGRGAHVLSLDDPLKNAEDAGSEVILNSQWNWYTTTARTRLMPGAAILLTMTHWADGDLAGRLMREMYEGGEQWVILRLKALHETTDVTADVTVPDDLAQDAGLTEGNTYSVSEIVGRLKALAG